jgi:hypothetical protein
MQLATTLQFRKVVRKYIAKKGLRSWGSFTNPSTTGQRTVGFAISNADDKMAAKIEKKLNKKGLTAKTRHTNSGRQLPSGCFSGSGHNYIRGTCVFAE